MIRRSIADVGAAICCPGDSAPAGGIVHAGCAPHSLFVLDKKRTRRARWKRKNRFNALRCSGPPRDGGRRIGASSDFARLSGTLWPSAIPVTAVPWRMVRRSTGCKNAFDQLLFPRVPLRYALPWRSCRLVPHKTESLPRPRRGRCPHRPVAVASSRDSQRQRKEKLLNAITTPMPSAPSAAGRQYRPGRRL